MRCKRKLFFAFCGQIFLSTSGLSHTGNPALLTPRDRDYPSLNPAPAHIVKFTAVVPPTLSHEFYLRYFVNLKHVGNRPSDLVSPHGCDWTKQSPFSVILPLKLKKVGNTYKAHFSMDHFLPGVCGWHLHGINNPDYNSDDTGWGDRPILIYSDNPIPENPNIKRSYLSPATIAPHIYVWCTRKAKPPPQIPQARGTLFCTTFNAIQTMLPNLPANLIKSVPVDERSWNIYLSPYTKSLTITFVDLDSLLQESNRGRSAGSASR